MDLMMSEGLFRSDVLIVGPGEGSRGMEPRVYTYWLVRLCGSALSLGAPCSWAGSDLSKEEDD